MSEAVRNGDGVADMPDLDGDGAGNIARIVVRNATAADFGEADFLF